MIRPVNRISGTRWNTIRLGQSVTYTVTATNDGPDEATFVEIAFQIPDQLSLVSLSCGLGISPDGPFCEYSSLPTGATVDSTLIATPKPTAAVRSRILTASVSTLFENIGAVDPAPTNNAASVKIKLIGKVSQPSE